MLANPCSTPFYSPPVQEQAVFDMYVSAAVRCWHDRIEAVPTTVPPPERRAGAISNDQMEQLPQQPDGFAPIALLC